MHIYLHFMNNLIFKVINKKRAFQMCLSLGQFFMKGESANSNFCVINLPVISGT